MKSLISTIVLTLFSVASYANATEFPAYQSEVVAANLKRPWAVSVLPDNSLIISEMSGQIRLFKGGLLSEPLSGVPKVYQQGQGGMLDVRPHPQFSQNQWVYFSYATGDINANALRLSRAKLIGNELQQLEQLITIAPLKDTPVHYGGRIAFLPDNSLLVTTGDGFDFREKAQTLDNLLGKIIRLNDVSILSE